MNICVQNIVMSASGHIKLVDWGTAKDLADTSLNGPDFVGTPEYMPPETINASKEKTTDCNADLWAFGNIVFQLLTGYPPFKDLSDYLTMQNVLAHNLNFPPGFPLDARDLVEQLLVVEPTARLGAGPDGLTKLKAHPFFDQVRDRCFKPVAELPCQSESDQRYEPGSDGRWNRVCEYVNNKSNESKQKVFLGLSIGHV